jgi:hypothetical protein
MMRNRFMYGILAALTLLAGLATRPLRVTISRDLAENLGDALWAMLVYWLIAIIWRQLPNWRVAMAALLISVAVEFGQLYHAPWLDAIRRTTLGGLSLGWGFSWSDLLAYAFGIAACFILDYRLTRRGTRTDSCEDVNRC